MSVYDDDPHQNKPEFTRPDEWQALDETSEEPTEKQSLSSDELSDREESTSNGSDREDPSAAKSERSAIDEQDKDFENDSLNYLGSWSESDL